MLTLNFLLLVACLLVTFTNAYNNGNWRGNRPLQGANTWCDQDICGLIDECPESVVRAMADGLVQRYSINNGTATTSMKDLGYDLVALDDCWSATTRDANGNLQPDPKLYPNGLQPVIDYVHSLGLRFGLYLCIGSKTCRKGRPGSFGFYDKDAAWIKAMNIDMVKIDNCNRPGGYSDEALYTNFSNYINATGHVVYINSCNWGIDNVAKWGPAVLQSYRIQQDHLPLYYDPFTKAAGMGFGQGTHEIIRYVSTLPKGRWTQPYFKGDPDFLMTLFDKVTMNFIESRTEFSFWSLWSSQLIVATREYNMSAEKQKILLNKRVIDVDQDPLSVPGWRQLNFNSTTGGEVWIKPLQNGDAVVLFWNDKVVGKTPINITIQSWNSDLGFNIVSGITQLTLTDLWANAPNTNTNTSFTISGSQSYTEVGLIPIDIKMYRVKCSTGPCMTGWWNSTNKYY